MTDIVLKQDPNNEENDLFVGTFDIEEATQAQKEENIPFAVHIKWLDDRPMMFRDAEGVVRPVVITVLGEQSDRYRSIEETQRKKKIKKFTGEVVHGEGLEKTAGCTTGWEGFTNKGQKVEFSQHNVLQIYKRFPHILQQVQEAMREHTNFSGNSSTQL